MRGDCVDNIQLPSRLEIVVWCSLEGKRRSTHSTGGRWSVRSPPIAIEFRGHAGQLQDPWQRRLDCCNKHHPQQDGPDLLPSSLSNSLQSQQRHVTTGHSASFHVQLYFTTSTKHCSVATSHFIFCLTLSFCSLFNSLVEPRQTSVSSPDRTSHGTFSFRGAMGFGVLLNLCVCVPLALFYFSFLPLLGLT